MKIIEKMIDHPLATFIVVGVVVDGISVLTHNLAAVFKK
jgi:hypothetical protein